VAGVIWLFIHMIGHCIHILTAKNMSLRASIFMDVAIVELQPKAGLQKIKKKVPYAVKQIFFSLF
jgi:hypothetical protein